MSKFADFRHEHVASVGSTNAVLLERAAAGDPGGLWLTAGQQTAGRGRSDRQWSSPPGNLYASLLLVDPCPFASAPGLGFVAGVALAQAIRLTAPQLAGVALKWPNDVLIAGAKVAGILPEAAWHHNRLAVVIGIGVNCAFFPERTPYPATSLAAAGVPVDPLKLFAQLRSCFALALERFDQGRGLPGILEDWKRHAHGIGSEITVKPPSGPLTGVFEKLDADGALVLRQGNTLQRITAGDVYFHAIPRQDPSQHGR